MIKINSINWTLQSWHIVMICIFMPVFTAIIYVKDKQAAINKADLELSSELNHILEQWVALPNRNPSEPVQFTQSDRWFISWGVGRRFHERSENAPDLDFPETLESSPLYKWEGDHRVLYHYGPRKRIIYAVGTPAAPILDEARNDLILGICAGALLGGFAIWGGYQSSKKALQPIEDFSQSAVKISQGKYDQRIDTTEIKTELKDLAVVLNGAFEHIEHSLGIQRKFTSDASHELRTPISIIILEMESALRSERTAEEYRDRITSALEAANRMKNLANSLLTLARLESGEIPLHKKPIRLDDLLRETRSNMQPALDEASIKTSFHPIPVESSIDHERMTQVITNILSNAIHHTPEGGVITLSTYANSKNAVIEISDTGSGIAKKDLPYIFDRFYRADLSRSPTHKRTGLGLAICQSIVQAHGGTISASSREGKGTCVTIRLPL